MSEASEQLERLRRPLKQVPHHKRMFIITAGEERKELKRRIASLRSQLRNIQAYSDDFPLWYADCMGTRFQSEIAAEESCKRIAEQGW